MKNVRFKSLTRLFRRAGRRKAKAFPADFEPDEIEDIVSVKPYTVTSKERIVSLIRAVKYLVANKIPGDIVECGVYKGGSIMAVLKTLLRLRDTSRHIWLYDTFTGMTQPQASDVSVFGETAMSGWQKGPWCCASLQEVQSAVLAMGYDESKIHFVRGKVEDTLPIESPPCVSLLRLDTDWYESTMQEMIYLFPALSRGGVIIIDDYGHWRGARRAVDEYLQKHNVPLLLSRIDYTGRIGVKI